MPAPFGTPLPTVSKTQPHFCEQPSPSMNEGVLGQVEPTDYTLALAAEALRVVRISAENTHKACSSIHLDPTLSEGAKHVKANEISYRVANKALPVIDRAAENVGTEIKRLQLKTAAPVADTTIKGIQLSTEIRLALRDMSQADRVREITRSIEQGDDSVISAILSARVMLTGLSPVEVEGFRSIWQQMRFAAEMARIDLLRKAEVHLQRGGQLLIGYQRKMSNPGIVAEAQTFAKASADAIAQATASN